MFPIFVTIRADESRFKDIRDFEKIGLSPLVTGEFASGGSIISLEEFVQNRNGALLKRGHIVDLPEGLEYWPTALMLLQKTECWLRGSVRAVCTTPRVYETMPSWIGERLLLQGTTSSWPSNPQLGYRPWREVSGDSLLDLSTLKVSLESLPARPWLSVLVLNSQKSVSEISAILDNAGFQGLAREFVTGSREEIQIAGADSSRRARFTFEKNVDRNMALNWAACHVRGDQLLILDDEAAISSLDGRLLLNESPNQQMFQVAGGAMIYLGILKQAGGFIPVNWNLNESLHDLAARLDLINYRIARLRNGAYEDYFKGSGCERESLAVLWQALKRP